MIDVYTDEESMQFPFALLLNFLPVNKLHAKITENEQYSCQIDTFKCSRPSIQGGVAMFGKHVTEVSKKFKTHFSISYGNDI